MIFDEEYYKKANALLAKKAKERLYGVWRNIKDRCLNENSRDYSRYGGRGIKICEEWRKEFDKFHEWAIKSGYKVELIGNGKNKWTIDRIDNNGDYCPENCRWVTNEEQANNKRTTHLFEYNGEVKNITQWANHYGVSTTVIYNAIDKNIPFEEAVKNCKHKTKLITKNKTIDKVEFESKNKLGIRYCYGELVYKSEYDFCRIYKVKLGYELRYSCKWDDNPIYFYETLKGAKLAMRNMAKGRYFGINKPSSAWAYDSIL